MSVVCYNKSLLLGHVVHFFRRSWLPFDSLSLSFRGWGAASSSCPCGTHLHRSHQPLFPPLPLSTFSPRPRKSQCVGASFIDSETAVLVVLTQRMNAGSEGEGCPLKRLMEEQSATLRPNCETPFVLHRSLVKSNLKSCR